MEKLGLFRTVRLTARGCYNFLRGRPLVVSFELTSSCNADCRHCDKGGLIEGEQVLSPDQIGAIYRRLRPVAVQLSGGEPLLRDDILDIVRSIKESSGAPYLILVTNGFLLERENYLRLCQVGINQFSISLDFPDERHDAFRRIPGLFAHLNETVPALTGMGHEDIVLNTAISRENQDDLIGICEQAKAWGSCISFSAYSELRTGNKDFTISSPEDLGRLRAKIDQILDLKKRGYPIRNSDEILETTYRFFAEGGIGGCMAGHRFLLVTPEGYHRPCAHKRVRFRSQAELIEGFSQTNRCSGCYVAIRSYCDKPFLTLVREQVLSRLLQKA